MTPVAYGLDPARYAWPAWRDALHALHIALRNQILDDLRRLVRADPALQDAATAFMTALPLSGADMLRHLSSPDAAALSAAATAVLKPPPLPVVQHALARLPGDLSHVQHIADGLRALVAPAPTDTRLGPRVGARHATPMLVAMGETAPTPPSWPQVVTAAVARVTQWHPVFGQAASAGLRVVLPWPAAKEMWFPHEVVEQHYPSGSVGFLPGACWIAIGADVDWTAEALVHEGAHQILHVVEHAEPLVADEAVRRHSPWQPAPRPLRGILHGQFAFGHALDFLRALSRDPSLPAKKRTYAQRRTRLLAAQLRLGREELLAGGLTSAGRTLVEALDAALELGHTDADGLMQRVVHARRARQQRDLDDDLLAAEVLEWVDRTIAGDNVCPYAAPSLAVDGTVVRVVHGRLSEALFPIAYAMRDFVSPIPPGLRDCLVLALPEATGDDAVALDCIPPRELLALADEVGEQTAVDLKSRVFDPAEPDSRSPPVRLWVLRAALADGS